MKAVLFDLDDTLFDRNKAQEEILHRIIHEFHEIFKGIDEKRIFNAFLESDRLSTEEFNAGDSIDVVRIERSRKFLNILGLSENFVGKITEMYIKSYPAINVPVKNAKVVIRNLAKKIQLGVISNGSLDVQHQKLETLGIKHLFRCIVLSEEVGIRKPKPGIFWKATTLLDRRPEECLYVGDSYNTDIAGAKKAGMQACWFNPKGASLSQKDVKPDFEIHTLYEILGILECV